LAPTQSRAAHSRAAKYFGGRSADTTAEAGVWFQCRGAMPWRTSATLIGALFWIKLGVQTLVTRPTAAGSLPLVITIGMLFVQTFDAMAELSASFRGR